MASSELAGESDNPEKLHEQLKTVQREREERLARFLKDFLNQYVGGDKEGFLYHAESEAKWLTDAGERGLKLCSIFTRPIGSGKCNGFKGKYSCYFSVRCKKRSLVRAQLSYVRTIPPIRRHMPHAYTHLF